MRALLYLPTEILIDILSFLPAADLFSVQRTCHTIRDIIDGTACLQYILHTHIMGIEDLLPPDFPYCDCFKPLRSHEQSWNVLKFNLVTKCFLDRPIRFWQYVFQDGHFIYEYVAADGTFKYSYSDVCAARSATQNEELRWVHIKVDNSCCLSLSSTRLTFAVDHNLVVMMGFISF